jgi:sugar lactone lactonase YvrE
LPDASFDIVVRTPATLGEGPCWDHGTLLWVDLVAGTLHRSDPSTGRDEVRELGGVLGAVVPTTDGRFAVVTGEGFGLLDDAGLTIVDPITQSPAMRMNDGKCDDAGRFWAGSTAYGFPEGRGSLHVWTYSAPPSRVAETGYTLPNGLGWSPDNTAMYVVDSLRREVYAYDFDLGAGEIANRRTLHTFGPGDGLPDGLAVDAQGGLWIALHGGGCIRHLDEQGALVGDAPLPVPQPTSCAFGNGSDLYVTSARDGLTTEDLVEHPLSGSVFRLDAGVTGRAVSLFSTGDRH